MREQIIETLLDIWRQQPEWNLEPKYNEEKTRDWLKECIQEWAPGVDGEILQKNFIYDRKFGTFLPTFGSHQFLVAILYAAHNPRPNVPLGKHDSYFYDYLLHMGMNHGKFDPFEEWITIPGTATCPSLANQDSVLCNEELLTLEEYEAIIAAGGKIMSMKEYFR